MSRVVGGLYLKEEADEGGSLRIDAGKMEQLPLARDLGVVRGYMTLFCRCSIIVKI